MNTDTPTRLGEITRALERLQRAVNERPARSFEWQCGLVALDDRIRLLRYCLSVEDQELVAAVAERLDRERRLELPVSAQPRLPHLATNGRIH